MFFEVHCNNGEINGVVCGACILDKLFTYICVKFCPPPICTESPVRCVCKNGAIIRMARVESLADMP
jgi:hypothetical protein